MSWKAQRQPVVALSAAEAEYIAASSMVQEVLHGRLLLEKLGGSRRQIRLLFSRITPRVSRAGGAVGGTDRAKHIDLREHFVHE